MRRRVVVSSCSVFSVQCSVFSVQCSVFSVCSVQCAVPEERPPHKDEDDEPGQEQEHQELAHTEHHPHPHNDLQDGLKHPSL